MRQLMYIAVMAVAFAIPATAQDGRGASIAGVIQGQIDAFRQDDFATAFTFASPMIQGLFGTPENFGSMVRDGYPMVHRPADVQFLDLDEAGNALRQKVMIRDGEGRFHFLEYEMIQTEAGWQINGVRFVQAPQVGA